MNYEIIHPDIFYQVCQYLNYVEIIDMRQLNKHHYELLKDEYFDKLIRKKYDEITCAVRLFVYRCISWVGEYVTYIDDEIIKFESYPVSPLPFNSSQYRKLEQHIMKGCTIIIPYKSSTPILIHIWMIHHMRDDPESIYYKQNLDVYSFKYINTKRHMKYYIKEYRTSTKFKRRIDISL